ncbi:MAG: glycosyltransferase [Desulfobacteraceae bacterium]|jgi:glycosyltransferase involved in cell wall biosynthesis|nr:MAG: glycosyltransferase [Desulfobacteraceae bacterium]
MNVLVVCSGNAPEFEFSIHQAFIHDQVNAVKRIAPQINFDFFFIKGKGTAGYLKSGLTLRQKIRQIPFDCLHAHFSLSAFLANFQRRIPVIVTFHGSDINFHQNRFLSLAVELFSRRTIYVSERLRKNAIYASARNSSIIPCGVDFNLFRPLSQTQARASLNLDPAKTYILFSSSSDVKVKNYPLARDALARLNKPNITLLELKGFRREEVALLLCAVDAALMTSFSEGSPQFIKEAMACNCPIVTTDVGDVREVIQDTPGCYITSFDPLDVAEGIRKALAFGSRTNGRAKIRHLDNAVIAEKIVQIYRDVEKRP